MPLADLGCRESYFWVLFCVHVCKWQELVPREELPEAAPDPDLWHSVSKENAILCIPTSHLDRVLKRLRALPGFQFRFRKSQFLQLAYVYEGKATSGEHFSQEKTIQK